MSCGDEIDKKILKYLESVKKPASTREIAISLNIGWHTANTHCLRLQIKGILKGYKLGNMNVVELCENNKK